MYVQAVPAASVVVQFELEIVNTGFGNDADAMVIEAVPVLVSVNT